MCVYTYFRHLWVWGGSVTPNKFTTWIFYPAFIDVVKCWPQNESLRRKEKKKERMKERNRWEKWKRLWWTLTHYCYNRMHLGQPGVLCNIWYPPETHIKPKLREISFSHNLSIRYPIVLKFSTEHGSDTAVLSAKFHSDWIPQMDVMDERSFARFEYMMSFGRISYIAQHPWILQPMDVCRDTNTKSQRNSTGRTIKFFCIRSVTLFRPARHYQLWLDRHSYIGSIHKGRGGARLRQWTGSSLIQVMACCIYAPPIHYLNQWGLIVNLTLVNKLQWNPNHNTKIFFKKNTI